VICGALSQFRGPLGGDDGAWRLSRHLQSSPASPTIAARCFAGVLLWSIACLWQVLLMGMEFPRSPARSAQNQRVMCPERRGLTAEASKVRDVAQTRVILGLLEYIERGREQSQRRPV